jgi:hypothetical protein
MKRFYSVAALAVLVVLASSLVGCGGTPTGTLVSLTLVPSSSSVDLNGSSTAAAIQYTVYGDYDFPTETRDVTNLVQWSSDIPSVGSFDPTHPGLMIARGDCGVTNVKATATNGAVGGGTTNKALIVAFGTFTVKDSASSNSVCH